VVIAAVRIGYRTHCRDDEPTYEQCHGAVLPSCRVIPLIAALKSDPFMNIQPLGNCPRYWNGRSTQVVSSPASSPATQRSRLVQ
jgi:hypothetical protein